MNSLLLSATVIVWLVIAYRWYGRIIDRRVVQPDDANEPPACSEYDGVDYCPGNRFVLFGHHFSSIAGAGPIIGPIAAVAAGLFWNGIRFLLPPDDGNPNVTLNIACIVLLILAGLAAAEAPRSVVAARKRAS